MSENQLTTRLTRSVTKEIEMTRALNNFLIDCSTDFIQRFEMKFFIFIEIFSLKKKKSSY